MLAKARGRRAASSTASRSCAGASMRPGGCLLCIAAARARRPRRVGAGAGHVERVIRIDGSINPASSDYLQKAIARERRRRRRGAADRARHARRPGLVDQGHHPGDAERAGAGDRLRVAAGRLGGVGGHLHHDGGARRGDGAGHEHRRRASGRRSAGAPAGGEGRRKQAADVRRREGREPARRLHRVDRGGAQAQRRVGRQGRARVGRDHRRRGARAGGDRPRRAELASSCSRSADGREVEGRRDRAAARARRAPRSRRSR